MTLSIASVRQEKAIAYFSCNRVLVPSVKSSLNAASKCSILRSNNKNFLGRGLAPSPDFSPAGGDSGEGTSLLAPHPSRRLGRLD